MLALNLATGLMIVGMFAAAPVIAVGSEQGGKQHAQEIGGTAHEPCSFANNANPAADPSCRQRVQTLAPSPLPGDPRAANGNQR